MTTAPSPTEAGKSGDSDNTLLNVLFVIIPLLLVTLLALIGVLIIRNRKNKQPPTQSPNGGYPGQPPHNGSGN